MQYIEARENKQFAVLSRLLLCLPIMLDNSPSQAFYCTLAMLDNGGLRKDLQDAIPTFHTDPRYSMVGTAIDAVEQLATQAVRVCEMLQSTLGAKTSP